MPSLRLAPPLAPAGALVALAALTSLTSLTSGGALASPSAPVPIGAAAPELTLPVAGGSGTVSLKDEVAQHKLTVVMFMSTRCPVSNAYDDRMAQLAKDYAGKGVAFIGVDANKPEGVDEIAKHAKEHGFSFPVLKDDGNKVADQYGARVTPEIFVVDAAGKVRYHGRIDEDKDGTHVKSPDLRTALDALLSGKTPARPETKAFGCSIKRA